jgi:hypothetical protein
MDTPNSTPRRKWLAFGPMPAMWGTIFGQSTLSTRHDIPIIIRAAGFLRLFSSILVSVLHTTRQYSGWASSQSVIRYRAIAVNFTLTMVIVAKGDTMSSVLYIDLEVLYLPARKSRRRTRTPIVPKMRSKAPSAHRAKSKIPKGPDSKSLPIIGPARLRIIKGKTEIAVSPRPARMNHESRNRIDFIPGGDELEAVGPLNLAF